MTAASPPGDAPDPQQDLHQRIERLRADGVLDDVGEGVVSRHLEERAHSLQAELDRLAPEYSRRVREDGQDAADAWLSQTGEDMGRRDAEETRRILSTVLTDAPPR